MKKTGYPIVVIGVAAFMLSACQGESAKEARAPAGKQQVESELAALRTEVLRVDKLPKGERLFEERCAICHGSEPYHPATRLLAKRYGEGKGGIVGRSDLTIESVKAVVRNGQLEMFPFRKVDLSDDDLDAIAKYVVGSAKP